MGLRRATLNVDGVVGFGQATAIGSAEMADEAPRTRAPAERLRAWVLHRHETLVGADYPLRERVARLSAQEDRGGVYSRPKSIGPRQSWAEALDLARIELRCHRVVRRPNAVAT